MYRSHSYTWVFFSFCLTVHQNTAETPHEEERCLWEALNLQTLLLVCACRSPVLLWTRSSSSALPVDLPHQWSSRRVPWRTAGSNRLSGKLSYYTSDLLYNIFVLQQKKEHRQHVYHQVHEEMHRSWAGRETSFKYSSFFYVVTFQLCVAQ